MLLFLLKGAEKEYEVVLVYMSYAYLIFRTVNSYYSYWRILLHSVSYQPVVSKLRLYVFKITF
jgi:hypothetical protein